MKALKIILILLAVYVGIVVVFESLIGYYQPQGDGTLVITTTDDNGQAHSRVVSRLISNDTTYVAANHWPRAWYHQALENPAVTATIEDETGAYTVVPITGGEYDQVNSEHALGLVFKILTGFPPRELVRLDPRDG